MYILAEEVEVHEQVIRSFIDHAGDIATMSLGKKRGEEGYAETFCCSHRVDAEGSPLMSGDGWYQMLILYFFSDMGKYSSSNKAKALSGSFYEKFAAYIRPGEVRVFAGDLADAAERHL